MKLSGLHLLLTYACTFECDHCFVWGSPRQSGVMSLASINHILEQAQAASVDSIYFEGGEPFLYYPILVKGVQAAAQRGFNVGIVTNGYWASTEEDAREWLRPLAGLISDLSISSDLFHYSEPVSMQTRNARNAAEQLGVPVGFIAIALPDHLAAAGQGQIPPGESGVMYRGRAAERLAPELPSRPWQIFDRCPHEDLADPGRLHVDPFGYLHLCQGLCIGNLFTQRLADICEQYDPQAHPVIAPLLSGGPAELFRSYNLPHASGYADACHLCYAARRALRSQFPEILVPDQMYGGQT